MELKQIHCKQLDCKTSVCDWYECPHTLSCEHVKPFYKFVRMNDDPDDVQFLDGILFYTTDSIMLPQRNKEERVCIADRWVNEH